MADSDKDQGKKGGLYDHPVAILLAALIAGFALCAVLEKLGFRMDWGF